MKNIVYLSVIILFTCLFQSCSDDEEDYSEWRKQNETAYNNITSNKDYFQVSSIPGSPVVYAKIIKSGDKNTPMPIIRSKVTVHYTGKLIDGTIFDTTEKTGNPLTFSLSGSGLITGWTIALQNMHAGDRWEVWIPWPLGYGTVGNKPTIPPYSTLIFEMELISVVEYPI